MGYIKDRIGFSPIDPLGVVGAITGQDAADAAKEAARIQQQGVAQGITETRASRDLGLGFLQPFQQLGQQGLDQASFLTDPQAQFDFLQNNPLFQSALENANLGTQNLAAARGRLSAGDTLQQLSSNVLLSASPLIGQQKQSINQLLGLGVGVAGTEANTAIGAGSDITNLITSGAAAQAGGVVGAANAKSQGFNNLLTGGMIALSDKRLKENITLIGKEKGHNIYSWEWNDVAKKLFGLVGESFGVLAQEVQKTIPSAIKEHNGYLIVDYELIGVRHAN